MAFAPGPRTAGLRRSFGGRVDAGPSIVMDPSGAELAAGMERWANLVPDFSEAWGPMTRLIHRHTSALRDALTGSGSGSRVKKTKDSLEVGIKGPAAEYGKYHQTGTPIMPARPPIKFSRNLRNKSGLMFTVSQMLQRIVVEHRKAALGSRAGVLDVEKRTASLERLSRMKTT